jgi:glutathione S-transferase
MKLIIGNKNYSSWSLRPWLLMRQAGIPFDEEVIRFTAPDFKVRVRRHSPAGKVPVLIDGDVVIWDSLAIVEYLAETRPDKRLWPDGVAARARARSLCAEMHAGFPSMRQRMPMNVSLRLSGVLFDVEVQRNVARVIDIWTGCRRQAAGDGPFLFGRFTIPDAYYAPVVRRFFTYGVALPEVARAYADAVDALPAMQEWIAAAATENDFFIDDEPYREPPAG